jgi:hypothetical protein
MSVIIKADVRACNRVTLHSLKQKMVKMTVGCEKSSNENTNDYESF